MQKTDENNETVWIDPDNCTGCLNCQLICSFVFERSFNPSLANIIIGGSPEKRDIKFSDECTECNLCVKHCIYGALTSAEEKT